ncbi:MAG: response regulator [Actinobacteria bacterium]|nr:response regulator [Actinomycetota bacterium]
MAALIMVVEDDQLNRYLVTYLLEKSGYEIEVAVDGVEALALLEKRMPRLILMDMQLPLLDGYEATRRIKADERFRSIPVVAITAHSTPRDQRRAIEAGVDDFVSKPVDADGLLALVKRLVGE